MEGKAYLSCKTHFLPEFSSEEGVYLVTVVCLLPMMAYGEEAMTVANDAVAKDKEVGQKVGMVMTFEYRMLYLRTLCF